jgi:hypothetical protein
MQNNTATKDGMIVACVKHAERALVDAERDFSLSDCPMVQQYHSGRIHALRDLIVVLHNLATFSGGD